MIDKAVYPALHEATESVIRSRTEWLQEAIKAQLLCESLPEEIKEMEISSVDYGASTLTLSIRSTPETVSTLKRLGIQGLKPQVSAYSKRSFHSRGQGALPDGTLLSIWVMDIEQPADCEVVEKEVTRKEYSLVCAKTGEEL